MYKSIEKTPAEEVNPYIKLTNYTFKNIPHTREHYEGPPSYRKLPELKPVGIEFEQYLTGFWEGDGSCCLTNRKYKQLTIGLYQKDEEILKTIRDKLEAGHLYRGKKIVSLVFTGYTALELLKILTKYVVCPSRVSQLSKMPYYYIPTKAQVHNPTESWFVGFWDAEGSSYLGNHYLSIYLSQKDKQPLLAIQRMFGFGKVYDSQHTWVVTSHNKENSNKITNLLLQGSLNGPRKRKLEEELIKYRNNQIFYQMYKEEYG